MGIKIIDAKVVGFCSKCRKEGDEMPRYTDGKIIEDGFIACINNAFGECKTSKIKGEKK